jgi:hypothetical protein
MEGLMKKIRPDEELVDLIGVNDIVAGAVGGDDQPQRDPIADLIQEAQFGLPRATDGRETLTIDETREALEAMGKQLHSERHEKLLKTVYPEMLERSDDLFGEESLTSKFLRAAITKDKQQIKEFAELFKTHKPGELQ